MVHSLETNVSIIQIKTKVLRTWLVITSNNSSNSGKDPGVLKNPQHIPEVEFGSSVSLHKS